MQHGMQEINITTENFYMESRT